MREFRIIKRERVTIKTLSNNETLIQKLMHGKIKCIAWKPNNRPGPISSLLTTDLTSSIESLLSLLWILKILSTFYLQNVNSRSILQNHEP